MWLSAKVLQSTSQVGSSNSCDAGMYNDEGTEGILLIDAKNALNNLKWEAALHNVHPIYPTLVTC